MSPDCSEDDPLLQKKADVLKADVLNPSGDLSFSGAALILFCTAVGAGVVAMPRAFSFSGWIAGMVALVVSAALSNLSLSCLFKCAQNHRGPSTYQSLVQKHLPTGLSFFVEIAVALLLLGAVGTMLLLTMHVWESVELATGIALLPQSHMPWAIFILATLLCLPRNFADLQGLSVVNVCSTLTVIILICFESSRVDSSGMPGTVWRTWLPAPGFSSSTSPTGLLAALSIILYGFFCQIQAPQLYSELQPSVRQNASLVGVVASTACCIIYVAVGVLGYAAFGVKTESDILAQLTKLNPGNHRLCLAQVLFGLVLLLSTPLVLAPLRSMLLRSLAKDPHGLVEAQDVSSEVHIATTSSILALAMVIALNVPGVDFIMGILGATCVVFLALIVPGLLTLRCCGGDWKVAGWTLVVAGSLCAPLTFGAFVATHLGYTPR